MNIWRIIMISLWLLSVSGVMQAQSYERLWQRVEQLEKDDLPKSVVEAAQDIYQNAEKEKNVPQMMKAFLTMTAYREIVSPDSLQVDIRKLEDWASSPETSKQDRAVLSSILAEMIIRTDFKKGDSYLKNSMKDSLLLIKYDAGKLVPLVKIGETSRRYFNDNLYELLARRAIQLWQQNRWQTTQDEINATINQTYQSLLSLYQENGNRSAWLLTALDAFPEASDVQLKGWIKDYGDLDVCAEVYLCLANLLQRKNELVECVDLLRKGIARYPDYERINALKNEERNILRPELWVNIHEAYPDDSMTLKVNYRNLTQFSVFIYQLDLAVGSPVLPRIDETNVTRYGKLIQKESFSLKPTLDYEAKQVELDMKAPSAGIYYVVMKPADKHGKGSGSLLYLTGLQMIQLKWNNQCEYIVLDKRTGHPVANAQISFYDSKNGQYVLEKTYTTDEQGTMRISADKRNGVFCRAFIQGDEAMDISYSNTGSGYYRDAGILEADVRENISLFTDRGIYRPGQRLYYSGIAYRQRQDMTRVVDNSSYTVKLMNDSHQLVNTQEVKTDSLGTFSGEFLLPDALMPGIYSIKVKDAQISFRVEEYKRPTFEVTLDSLKNTCQLGDSVNIKGIARAFSGAPIAHATVKYRIDGRKGFYWRGGGSQFYTASGETTTDAEGRFVVPVCFVADKDNENSVVDSIYEITAEVTNLAGETQVGTMCLPIGKEGIDVSLESWKNKVIVKEEHMPLRFSVVNSLGVDIHAKVQYQVFRQEKGKDDVCVLNAEAVSNTNVLPERIYALPSGKYLLKATVEKDGGKASMECPFTLFSLNDRELPYETDMWSYQKGTTFDEDNPVSIYWGSSRSDVYLFYDVFSGDKRLESNRIVLSDSLLVLHFSYKKEYGDGVRICFAFVKEGRLYKKEFQIKRPQPDKELELTWKTFRDKLLPGQKETWILNVRYPDGTPANAQLMASMYDASLDQYVSHRWNLGLHYDRYIPFVNWSTIGNRYYFWDGHFLFKRLECKELDYSILDIPVAGRRKYKEMMVFMSAGNGVAGTRNQMYAKAARPVSTDTMEDVVEEENVVPLEQEPQIQLRSDFAETAFFYPQLRTNAEGEVQLEFTLPESLTEWKFMGLAHTKDMDYGQLDATVRASKDFMLQPNLPRFVRVGDKVSFTASLINLTEKEIKGKVRMELFNPETDKVFHVQKQSFEVGPEETSVVAFSFQVKEENTVLACRMVAEGNGFSDGEQRYLPVLTNKQWITESVSLDVDSAGTYRFSLEELFNAHSKTVSNPRMIVEYTGNPMWYAVQALPVVAEPDNDNVYSWAAAYYANALAAYIAQTNPRIRQVIETWRIQLKGMEVLQSSLQRNEELKELLLEETPWVSDAVDETAQKQRILALFDENTLTYRLSLCIEKLKEMQNEQGAWSWYKGMPSNQYMTTQVLELLARLQAISGGVRNKMELKGIYQKAFDYLTGEIRKEYEALKKAEKQGEEWQTISRQAMRYLYICALDDSFKPEKTINDYLISKLESMSRNMTVYEKSLSAIVLLQNGRKAEAEKMMQSVMEYSVLTEEMGRYFDTSKAPYSWMSYKIPTEVMALEASSRLMKDELVIEQMKRWLLKQKQTQSWETPVATADAVYALLCTGKDALVNQPSARIAVGKEILNVLDDNSIGYLKTEIKGDVMAVRDVTVEKDSDGMAWGAVYAQFLEDMQQVNAQSRSLAVSRTILKDGKPVSGEALSVGDRITVRLVVSSDRDMDFVQVKDERAACLEPVNTLSGYHWNNGLGYYQVTKDASTSFFFDQFRKGVHVLEYEAYVTASGVYQQGVATVRSVYAPEYGGHSDTMRLKVK